MTEGARGSILTDAEIESLLGGAIRPAPGAPPIGPEQLQPASLDLRLARLAWRVRAGFLPGRASIEERLAELSTSQLSLEGDGAVLERGLTYLVALEEELELPPELTARFNPRSSTGRCDLFTRVLAAGHPRFDEAPGGFRGRLWLEIAPLSFPVKLKRGDRLAQMRLARGRAELDARELAEHWQRQPLAYHGQRALAPDEVGLAADGSVALSIGLEGRSPCAWRAAHATQVVRFAAEGQHDALDYFEPLQARGGRLVLEPGSFYLLASRERILVPPELAAEMLPVDVGIGELRNNYAGFFDPGFGCAAAGEPPGTTAVLEVRAHDLPFLIEDGQVLCRLSFFRTERRPRRLYGDGRVSYRRQGLALARPFRLPGA
jgi:dCTP deaminase